MKKCKPKRWNLTLSLMLFVLGVIMMALLAGSVMIFLLNQADLVTNLPEQGAGFF